MNVKEVKYISEGQEKSYFSAEVKQEDLIDNPLWFHKRGLQETRSGYGRKLRTPWMIRHEGRLKRVYCQIFSNVGSLYIISQSKRIYIDTV